MRFVKTAEEIRQIQAINARDLPLIRSAVLVVATFFVLINLAVDLLYGVLDPRIRYT